MYLAAYLIIGLLIYAGANGAYRREEGHNMSIGPMTWVVLGWPIAVTGAIIQVVRRRTGKDSSGGTNNGED